MTHTYRITGMSCDGCRSHVESALNNVPGVTEAKVNLEKATATIDAEDNLPIDRLKAALNGTHYDIEDSEGKPVTYSVTGMSCDGCRNFVQSALEKVSGVEAVTVDLKTATAAITGETALSLEKLQGALAGSHYQIMPLQNKKTDTGSGSTESGFSQKKK